MRRIHLYFQSLVLLIVSASCQELESGGYGSIAVKLENSPVVEVVTKAGADDVDVDDFNVYISSETSTYTYIYKDMHSMTMVPVGTYYVAADNVTEAASLSEPDIWGQARYAGETSPKEVTTGLTPTQYSILCKMTNAAVSVVFGEHLSKHFKDYKVTAYTVQDRKLVYDADNASSAKGYFSPAVLHYEFGGSYLDDAPLHITGKIELKAATHLKLNFRMSQENGAIGKPDITVDPTFQELYQTITVDPSEGGSFVIE